VPPYFPWGTALACAFADIEAVGTEVAVACTTGADVGAGGLVAAGAGGLVAAGDSVGSAVEVADDPHAAMSNSPRIITATKTKRGPRILPVTIC